MPAQEAFSNFARPGEVSVSDLLRAFACPQLDEASARSITGSLAYSGMTCTPNLFEVLAANGRHPSSEDGVSRYDASAIAVGAEDARLPTVSVATTPQLALQGVAIPALVIASVGYYRWWPYAVVSLVATALTIIGLLLSFSWATRVLPGGFPRGRTLGGVVVTIVSCAAVLLFAAVR